MWKYINFLLKSTNQHGVHSPFVFQYITKGVYQNKSRYKQYPPSDQWLLASLDYFQPKSIYWDEDKLQNTLNSWQVVRVAKEKDAAVVIKMIHSNTTLKTLSAAIDLMHEDQLILLINETYNKSLLNQIRLDDDVVVMVDFYYGVLISKRKEQLKQNFYIRL